MIDHDALFKALIAEFFIEFLELFLPKLAANIEINSIQEKEQELITDIVGGQTLRVDLIRQVQLKNKLTSVLILVEPQSYEQKEFSERLFRYFIRLYDKYRLMVRTVAVLSYERPKTVAPSQFILEMEEFKSNIFNYTPIQLNRLKWQDFINKPNPVACAMMVKMRVAKRDRARVKLAALTQLTELGLNEARVQLVSAFIDTYLRLDEKEQAQFERELAKAGKTKKEEVMKLTTSWKEEGLAEGRAEGLAIGRATGKREGEINLLLILLTRRFGPLKVEEAERVQTLSEGQLENLAQAIFDFQTRAQLEQWLNNQIG